MFVRIVFYGRTYHGGVTIRVVRLQSCLVLRPLPAFAYPILMASQAHCYVSARSHKRVHFLMNLFRVTFKKDSSKCQPFGHSQLAHSLEFVAKQNTHSSFSHSQQDKSCLGVTIDKFHENKQLF